jgi:hypothetical protein
MFNPQRGVPGAERLSVYAGGYIARTREALAEVYDAVRQVLGDRAFSEMADDYAKRYPSHDYNLSLVGRHLPEFLATAALAQQLPFLPDLARLEWLVCRAFHAFEQPTLNQARLTSLSLEEWQKAQLTFQPSTSVMASAWPILDIWESRTRPRKEISIDLVNRPQRVLVFRQRLHVRCELLTEAQYALLSGLLAGRALGVVCGELAASIAEAPLPVAEWFARWAGSDLIVDCRIIT